MNQIFNSNGTIVCRNIPTDINRFEITEIFNKYGPLLGDGIYFGKKNSNTFFIKYVNFKDAVKAYESLKDNKSSEYDFKVSLSKSDEIKYKAIKGDKKSLEELKNVYKNNDQIIITEEMRNEFINEINEYVPEFSKKKREDPEKKKDKSFILNLLTKVDEPRENEQDNKLKEELKNYLNLNCLCAYNFDENNKLDNYLIPTFPN
ncbi:RNA-binding protein, putative [Plasmodium vinckei vinckei]|uniref:RNA-binding protein, putative n=1 Tax=Plasmodium vinckei vinckei TaxID=54757 RepID=A0A449BMT8_PLAVN|nr:RNA-binding protein, putative [Plasmodium vinckei vinckei]VEV54771.1 RNA-binding protein, putative [Plasmodium vinckei vinckei]